MKNGPSIQKNLVNIFTKTRIMEHAFSSLHYMVQTVKKIQHLNPICARSLHTHASGNNGKALPQAF